MDGGVELAEEVFHMPVRLGNPQSVNGLADVIRNPIYATGVGLLLYGHHYQGKRRNGLLAVEDNKKGVMKRMKMWFKNNF